MIASSAELAEIASVRVAFRKNIHTLPLFFNRQRNGTVVPLISNIADRRCLQFSFDYIYNYFKLLN